MELKTKLIIFIIIISFGCSERYQKVEGQTWIIKEGILNNKKIEFNDNSSITILEKYNDSYNLNPKLFFRENGNIRLPGIDSKDIYGKWSYIGNNCIKIELDTSKYNYIHRKIDTSKISNKDFFGNELKMSKKEAQKRSFEFSNNNPIKTNQFKIQMNIYGNEFKYNIENDILKLESKTTKIIAKRDKSIENIVNEYK
ncbi:hypothetical protein [Polaribacter sp. Z022]|uniref:hypothetical protein n=1 Tax=Polaribacter sp. Z022 TaxID=2927125 RepID=UPI0020214622|nr:hypothetical protein [Polaribacter sp. Z022]MCL7755167.1 hypothetical protein [Polaribacter sp. Z022]